MTKLKLLSLFLFLILISGTLPACTPGSLTSSTTSTIEKPAVPPDKVAILYFHRTQRWASCICFEDGLTRVVTNYFQDDINNGKLTVGIYDTGDAKNADLVKKYNAVGPQLFITTITNGIENTRDIQSIWSWSCVTDNANYDAHLRETIDKSLLGEE